MHLRGVIFLHGVFSLWQLKPLETKLRSNAPNARAETTTVSKTKRTIPIDWFFRSTALVAESTPNTKNRNKLNKKAEPYAAKIGVGDLARRG